MPDKTVDKTAVCDHLKDRPLPTSLALGKVVGKC